jgi:hypothetical protein
MQNSEQTGMDERMDEETTFVSPSFILSHRSVRQYCEGHYYPNRDSCCPWMISITVYQLIMTNEVIDELKEDALLKQIVNDYWIDYMADTLPDLIQPKQPMKICGTE